MFDTMTMTKIIGGLCGTLLVFLLGGWVAEEIYHTGGGHGDHHEQAYTIPVEGADDHSEPVEVVEVNFEEIYASADASEGAGVFRQCQACHSLEPGDHGTGPSLYGVVNRAVGAEEGFGYSGSLVAVNDVWTGAELFAFLEDPGEYAPGTAMSSYAGLRKTEDRADLIAYLDSLDD